MSDELPPQEATDLVVQVAENEHAELAWKFARQHIHELLPRVDEFDRNGYVPSILGCFSDASRAEELLPSIAGAERIRGDARKRAMEAAEGIRFKAASKQRRNCR